MEDLLELLKKSLGMSQDTTMNTDASLLSDNRTSKTLNLMGLLGSPEALTGLGLISAGIKGQGIGEAALPSFVEGLKVSSAVKEFTKEQAQQKSIEEFADKVPEQFKPLFKAFPKETMKLLLTPTKPTISGEALKVASKLQGLDKTEFNKVFRSLSKVEQDLYNNQILGRQDVLSKLNIDLSQPQTEGTQKKITLTSKPDPKSLIKNQIYNYQENDYIWDGSQFIPQ